MEKPRLIYVGDPMCSWCYGFAPEIIEVAAHYSDQMDFMLIMGGLRPGTKDPMDAKLKAFLHEHWEEIGKKTGQPFKYDLLNEETVFVYDTEPPARAVVTMRKLAPEKAFDFFKAIQHAFYAENKNTGDIQTYLDLLPEGVDPVDFRTYFESDEARQETAGDYSASRSLGVSGFPAVLVMEGQQVTPVSYGYTTAKDLIKRIERAIKS